MRREIATKERSKEIIERVAKQAKKRSEEYLKLIDQKDYEEISRRFSMLTEPFITECLKRVNQVLHELKIVVSGATLVDRLISIMTQMLVIIPEIGPTKCVLVRKRVAEFIAHTITQIKNDRLKCIRENRVKKKNKQEIDESEISTADERFNKHVSMNDSAHIIDESKFIYLSNFDEFIGELKSVSDRKTEKTVRKQEIACY